MCQLAGWRVQGVSWCRIMRKWRAQFGSSGKCRNLGYYDNPVDAVGMPFLQTLSYFKNLCIYCLDPGTCFGWQVELREHVSCGSPHRFWCGSCHAW